MTQYRATKGDILVSKINARKKAIGIVESEIDVGHTIHFRAVTPHKNKINREFLWMALRSGFCQAQFSIETGGMGKGEISEDRLLTIRVPRPPIEAQKAIVSHWHAAQKNLALINSSTETEKVALRDWLSTELGIELKTSQITKRAFAMNWQEIERWSLDYIRRKPILAKEPDKYPLVRLGQVIKDLSNGWSPKCLDRPVEGDEWGVLKLGAVSFGTFNENENKALPKGLQPRKSLEIKPGDLLISRANITRLVGACALVNETRPNLILCDKIFRVIPEANTRVNSQFISEVMKLPYVRNQIENAATGTSPTMKNITKPSLLALKFPLPPLEVQESLLKHITSERKRIAKERQTAEKRSAQMKIEVEEMILGHRPAPSE